MMDEHMHEPHSRRPMECRLCKTTFTCKWRAVFETGDDYIFLADTWTDATSTALVYAVTTSSVDTLLRIELIHWED
jgi:hypothetical protein